MGAGERVGVLPAIVRIDIDGWMDGWHAVRRMISDRYTPAKLALVFVPLVSSTKKERRMNERRKKAFQRI